jgi:secreted trypsin-like serine protease
VCKKPNGAYKLVGISSWGIGCGDGWPSVFVDVQKLSQWIRQTVVTIRMDDSEEKHFFV